MLDARDAQAGHAAAIDRALPAGTLLEAERVALAGLVDGQETAGDGGNHFGLAAHHPASRRGRRQRVERQGLAERSDYLGWPKFLILEHITKPQNRIVACR